MTPDPNKAYAVLISGESRTGKSALVPWIAALSAETNYERPVKRYSAPVGSGGLESALFGASPTASGSRPGGEDGLLGMASTDGTVLVLDEAENLSKVPAIQNKFLDAIDSGEYRRWGEGETQYVNKAKLVLITMEDPQEFHPALLNRTRAVRMPAINERTGDIRDLAEHFLIELERYGSKLTDEAIEFLQGRDWTNVNVAGLKAVIEIATAESDTTEIDGDAITAAWLQYSESRSTGGTEGGTPGVVDAALVKEFSTAGSLVEAAGEILRRYRDFAGDRVRLARAADVVDEAITKHKGRKQLVEAMQAALGETPGAWQGKMSRFARAVDDALQRRLEGARAQRTNK